MPCIMLPIQITIRNLTEWFRRDGPTFTEKRGKLLGVCPQVKLIQMILSTDLVPGANSPSLKPEKKKKNVPHLNPLNFVAGNRVTVFLDGSTRVIHVPEV